MGKGKNSGRKGQKRARGVYCHGCGLSSRKVSSVYYRAQFKVNLCNDCNAFRVAGKALGKSQKTIEAAAAWGRKFESAAQIGGSPAETATGIPGGTRTAVGHTGGTELLGKAEAAEKVLRTYDLSQVEADEAIHFRCDVDQALVDVRRLDGMVRRRTTELNLDEIRAQVQRAMNALLKVHDFTGKFTRS